MLYFVNNQTQKKIAWLVVDDQENVIKKGTSDTYADLKDQANKIIGYIFSPSISIKTLEVPPAIKAQIRKSVPFLLEDSLLGNIEEFHFETSERDKEGKVLISLIPTKLIKTEVGTFKKAGIDVESLFVLETSLSTEEGSCSLVVFEGISVINFANKWGWCAETDTILNMLERGREEFSCFNLNVFINTKTSTIDWTSVTSLVPKIEHIDDELDFLEKNLSSLNQKDSLLFKEYAPRIHWETYFLTWRYTLAAIFLVVGLYFTQLTVDIFQDRSLTQELDRESLALFYSTFPEESKKTDLRTLLKSKLKGTNLTNTEPFLLTLTNLSQIIANNERVSLFSINYDLARDQLVVELQCTEFDDLESVKSIFNQSGYLLEVGSSKRIGSSILSEIFIKRS